MIEGELKRRVDLEKLTQDDFRLKGEFRVKDGSYHGWRVIPEFKPEGGDTYVFFDQLFSEDRSHQCYELIIQTPDRSIVVASGYLHKSPRGDVCFGVRSGIKIQGQAQGYINSSPVWFNLLDDKHRLIIEEVADWIFVRVSHGTMKETLRDKEFCVINFSKTPTSFI